MTTSDPASLAARAAAEWLTADYGPGLVADVEAELSALNSAAPRPDRHVDTVSVASLIVAVATLAWTVYTDLRSKTSELSPEAVVRRVRIALAEHGGSNQPDAARITEIVVNEIISPAGERLRDRGIYFQTGIQAQTRSRPISISALAWAARIHVAAPSDAQLRERLLEDRAVFLRGAVGTGRRSSAIVALDLLTGMSRETSQVSVVEATFGLDDLPDGGPDVGYLLDASEEDWADSVTEAQIARAGEGARRSSSFLVILVRADRGRSLPGTVVDHTIPDLAQVVVSHLAARMAVSDAMDRIASHAILDEACQTDRATAQWYEQLTTAPTARTVEAAQFAEAVWSWCERRTIDPAARLQVEDFHHHATRDDLGWASSRDAESSGSAKVGELAAIRGQPGSVHPGTGGVVIEAGVIAGYVIARAVRKARRPGAGWTPR